MKRLLLVAALLLSTVAVAWGADQAVITTRYGAITIALYADKAPKTVANFEKLARQGFYNGLTFHRVVPGFVVQGGDPKGNGSGGPGYDLPAEIDPHLKHLTGTVAMARLPDSVNPQRRSSGSQFYICLAPQPELDGKYTIFGRVVKGMDRVFKIRRGDRMEKVTIRSGSK